MRESDAKHMFEIRIYSNGDFGVFKPGTDEEYKEGSEENFLRDIREKKVRDSIVNPFFTYLETGSGWIIVGGRLIPVP